ncbi:rubrerythrin family protein [Pleomorphomonas oryzae]|uniref:rubrerythrin family protein n=1 Tax=Pleomorphomonas oryzae TaxID=261934 RepID=UPI00040B854D|nr:rubrerythrin family protein [Pleomorphomonas oryzae]
MPTTTDNLKEAFAGESQANRKYLAYADAAVREGKLGVAKLFRAVAAAETIHAHAHLRALGAIKGTADNLADAMAGESHEFTSMYPAMVATAKAEGHKRAIRSMSEAMEVEKIHYGLFGDALEAVKAGGDLGNVVIRICPNCGHTVIGDAPDACPVCACAGEHYKIIE